MESTAFCKNCNAITETTQDVDVRGNETVLLDVCLSCFCVRTHEDEETGKEVVFMGVRDQRDLLLAFVESLAHDAQHGVLKDERVAEKARDVLKRIGVR